MIEIVWTEHALERLTYRGFLREQIEDVVRNPTWIEDARPPKKVYMKIVFDEQLQKDVLLRVFVAATINKLTVVTMYKTTQIKKYLRGVEP